MLFEFWIFFNRPISPHLTIYLSQISSISSILHRFSGIFLIFSIFIYILFNNLLINYYFLNLFIYLLNYNSFLDLIYFNIELIFYYHFFNGLRFILLNFGFFINLEFITYIYFLFLFINIVLILKLFYF